MADEYQGEDQVLDQGQAAGEGAGGSQASDAGAARQPANLEEAFKLVREDERRAASTDVEEGSGGDAAGDRGDGGDDGGSPAAQQPVDNGGEQRAVQQQAAAQRPVQQQQRRVVTSNDVRQSLAQQAVNQTRAEFAKQGVRELSLGDLYVRDENTGRVTFQNPDDPNRPFSSRTEAQDFVNAWNQNIQDEQKRFATELYQEMQENQRDVIALLDFAPTYDSMPQAVRNTFDALLAPYQHKDADGVITFPGANFNLLAQQANNLVALQQRQTQQKAAAPSANQQTKKQSSGPALDLKGGQSESGSKPVPKTLAEAMKLVNEERAKERKKK